MYLIHCETLFFSIYLFVCFCARNRLLSYSHSIVSFLKKIFFSYLTWRKRAREHKQREWQEREKPIPLWAGSPTGAPSQDPEITMWAEGRCLVKWDTQVPLIIPFNIMLVTWSSFSKIYLFMQICACLLLSKIICQGPQSLMS